MKRLILFFAGLFAILAMQAQIGIASVPKYKPFAEGSNIRFGVKAGVNFADWGGDDADGFDMTTTFHGGAMVQFGLGEMFGLQPEVMFSGRGAKTDGGKYALGYLAVPIMLQYLNASGFYAELGPEIAFLLSAKAKPDDGDDVDVKDLFKSTDFSVGVGIGYRMKNGFGIGGRYNFGLANIVDEDNVDVKNSVISLGLSYMFGGSK